MLPMVVGLNCTSTVQLALAASVAPQFRVSTNWLALVPPRESVANVIGSAVVLDTVMVRFVLVLPRARFPNAMLLGATVKLTATPVPLRATDCVVVPIRMATAAVFAPALVGRNVAVTVQLAFAASEVPQVRARANWLGFVPESVGAASVSDALLVLRTVTTNAVLVLSKRLPKAKAAGETVNGEGAVMV